MRLIAVALAVATASCVRQYTPHAPRPVERSESEAVTGPSVTVLAPSGGVREGAIAISPPQPRTMIAAGIHYLPSGTFRVETWRSNDGGTTWVAGGALPMSASGRSFASTWDPVLAFDRTGVAYLSAIGAESSNRWTVLVYRSSDGGQSWRVTDVTPGVVGMSDKEWLAVDNSGSRYDGSIYVAWATFGSGTPSGLHIARSRDGGSTWSETQPVPSGGSPFIVVGGEGKVYASQFGSGSGLLHYEVMRSDDGGETFRSPVPVASVNLAPRAGVGSASTSMHHMAGDVSSKPTRGNVYVVFPSADAVLGVWFSRSANQGATWSAPVRLSLPSADTALPSITADAVSGEVVVTWLDGRDDPQGSKGKLWTRASTDGGVTFGAARPVTDGFELNGHAGDYNQTAAFSAKSLAMFSDTAGHLAVARLAGEIAPPPPSPPVRRRAARH